MKQSQRRNIFLTAKRLFGCLLWGVLFFRTTQAQPKLVVPTDRDYFSSWSMKVDKTTGLKVNDVVTIQITGTPTPLYHLYSSNSAPDPEKRELQFRPTIFILEKESRGAVLAGPMSENVKAHEEFDEIMEGIVRHFEPGQTVTFSQKIKITQPTFSIAGTFSFQNCNDVGVCSFGNFDFTWAGTAEKSELVPVTEDTTPVPQIQDTNKIPTTVQVIAPTECKEEIKDTGLECPICMSTGMGMTPACNFPAILAMFFQAFLFGLFAIFTPCVFPIIPLNVSFFTKQSKTRSEGIRNGLIYAGFIVFIYVVLGLGLTMLFGGPFLYNFSTHWITNVVFFVLLVVFALSFFGWFEITLPSSWSTKLDSKSERGGVLGIFFMALTLVVVSFSCTGPIVGSVLISAASGECLILPAVGMFGFSLALSIPFAALSIFPGFMNSMPKSGGWLNSVKVVLGFIELALALKFLSASDLVMGWHLLERDVFLGIWVALFVLLGVYLLGYIRLPHDSPVNSIAVPRLMLAIMSFSFAMILIPGMFGKPIPILEGVIPPITQNIGVNVRGGVMPPDCDPFTLNGKICAKKDRKYLEYFKEVETEYAWFFDLCEAIEFAKKENRPLFIDFTGHTCANCRKMEQAVFPDPVIERYLREEYVLVSLWVDDDNPLDSVITLSDKSKIRKIGQLWLNVQAKLLNTQAQPYYVLMDHNTELLAAPQGFTPNAAAFKNYLQSGLTQFKTRHADQK